MKDPWHAGIRDKEPSRRGSVGNSSWAGWARGLQLAGLSDSDFMSCYHTEGQSAKGFTVCTRVGCGCSSCQVLPFVVTRRRWGTARLLPAEHGTKTSILPARFALTQNADHPIIT